MLRQPNWICTLGSAAWPESGITAVLWVVFFSWKKQQFHCNFSFESFGSSSDLLSDDDDGDDDVEKSFQIYTTAQICMVKSISMTEVFPRLQVGKLYIHYQLEVGNGAVVEMQHIACLLKDEKELCIQKDHISDTQEICR